MRAHQIFQHIDMCQISSYQILIIKQIQNASDFAKLVCRTILEAPELSTFRLWAKSQTCAQFIRNAQSSAVSGLIYS